MRPYDPDWPLFSIHIPKCGGTSLRRVLQKWFNPRFYFHVVQEQTSEKPKRFDLARGLSRRRRWLLGKRYPPRVCVHGHFNHRRGYGVFDYYPDARQFITFLRDPFDLAISIYFFAKKQGEERIVAGVRRPIRNDFADLNAYVERKVMVKPSIISEFIPFPLDATNLELELSKRFVFIGITEESDKSLERLSYHLGFPYTPMPRANISDWDEPIPSGAREEYRRLHPVEYALYDFARARYLD